MSSSQYFAAWVTPILGG